MPRKPKPKNTLSAGERVALAAQEKEKQKALSSGEQPSASEDSVIDIAAEKTEKPRKVLPKPQHATER